MIDVPLISRRDKKITVALARMRAVTVLEGRLRSAFPFQGRIAPGGCHRAPSQSHGRYTRQVPVQRQRPALQGANRFSQVCDLALMQQRGMDAPRCQFGGKLRGKQAREALQHCQGARVRNRCRSRVHRAEVPEIGSFGQYHRYGDVAPQSVDARCVVAPVDGMGVNGSQQEGEKTPSTIQWDGARMVADLTT